MMFIRLFSIFVTAHSFSKSLHYLYLSSRKQQKFLTFCHADPEEIFAKCCDQGVQFKQTN
jgi:hypothetical protein